MGMFGKRGPETASEAGEQNDTSIQIGQKVQELKMLLEGYDLDSIHPDRIVKPNPEEIMKIVSSELPGLVDQLAGKDDNYVFEQMSKLFKEIGSLRQMVIERLPISDEKRSIVDAFKELEAKLQA